MRPTRYVAPDFLCESACGDSVWGPHVSFFFPIYSGISVCPGGGKKKETSVRPAVVVLWRCAAHQSGRSLRCDVLPRPSARLCSLASPSITHAALATIRHHARAQQSSASVMRSITLFLKAIATLVATAHPSSGFCRGVPLRPLVPDRPPALPACAVACCPAVVSAVSSASIESSVLAVPIAFVARYVVGVVRRVRRSYPAQSTPGQACSRLPVTSRPRLTPHVPAVAFREIVAPPCRAPAPRPPP